MRTKKWGKWICVAAPLLFCFLGIIVWLFWLRDGSAGKDTDVINIVFFVIFFGITVLALIKSRKIALEIEGLSKATDCLRKCDYSGNPAIDGILDHCFKRRGDELLRQYKKNYIRISGTMNENAEFSCNIDDYFNSANFDEFLQTDLLNQFPGILTGVGMIGTFVGLTLGLAKFNFSASDADAIAANIEPLMSCIKLAFITSIFGLVLSIVFNYGYRFLGKYLSEQIDQFVDEFNSRSDRDSNDGLNIVLKNQNAQTKALGQLGTSIADTVAQKLEVQMLQMEDTYKEACERLEQAQKAGMDHLVDKFTEKLLGTITESISRLSVAVEETCNNQKDISEQIQKNLLEITGLSHNTVEIHKKSTETVTKLKEYTDHLDEKTSELVEQVEKNSKAVALAQANFNKFNDVADALGTATYKMIELVESIEDCNDKITDQHEEHVKQLQGKFEEQIKLLQEIESDMNSSVRDTIMAVIENAQRQTTTMAEMADAQREEMKNVSAETANTVRLASESFQASAEKIENNMDNVASRATDSINNEAVRLTHELEEHVATAAQSMLEEQKEAIKSLSKVLSEYENTLKESSKLVTEKIDNFRVSTETIPATMQAYSDSMKGQNDDLVASVTEEITALRDNLGQCMEGISSLRRELQNGDEETL